MVSIRQARVDDAASIAEGIYEAFLLPGSEMENDPSFHQQLIDALTAICAQTDTQYSYTNTLVAEADGEIAVIMIAVDGAIYRYQRERMFPQLKMLFNKVFGQGWEEMEDEAQTGELYVDSIVVFPAYRHRGIGTSMLLHAQQRAKELNIPQVTLAVEPTNAAKKLYHELGFSYNRQITIFNEEYELLVADGATRETI
jgi:ribosomal protein S18 acetylase RimI-like enzyme